MDRFKNLQLVGKNSSNLPNKCIYMGMVCRYSVKGATTLVHRFAGRCSLIAHFKKYSPAVFFGWQTCYIIHKGDIMGFFQNVCFKKCCVMNVNMS